MDSKAPLSRLDLNLLVALDALLTERNVSRAAQRLHLSQPSLSASLARLRTHFGDQLLARHGNAYELTPLATLLAEHVTSALEGARRVFEIEAGWNPRDSTREFSVYMSDYGLATIAPIVARLAHETAPSVRFRFLLHSPTVIDEATERLRSVDGIVLPHGFLNDLPFTDVWRDEWVIVSSVDNPACERGLTFEDLGTASWVLSYQTRTAFTSAIRQLQQLGVEPNVEVVAESFLSLPQFVIGTNRLAMVQRGIARIVRQLAGVAIHEPPYDATPLSNALWWHPMHRSDPSHEWMRDVFVSAGRELRRELQRDTGAAAQ
ncbi:MAG TPA: LysR family transcriptional regulator [Microbacterium sp.]|nr:LysR family transcriptional regulator [Microbacterium sp.]